MSAASPRHTFDEKDEKRVAHIEGQFDERGQFDVEATERALADRERMEKKLLRKLDARMSILILIYILNYIDRNNMSAARNFRIEKDLGTTGQQFPTLLSILYVGYILMQIPSNLVVQYTGRPSFFLPGAMFVWGVISILTGITHNFTGALLTRFFLGFVEAAFFPGALLLLSNWYTRKELAKRSCILYCGALISNAFGPLMAVGILKNMDGNLGHASWRWLFYIEGALTCFVAILAVPILPDFPHNSRGFTVEERALAVLRMTEDSLQSDQEQGVLKGLVAAVTDPKVWLMTLSLTGLVISLSFNQFFPQITKTLGYDSTITLVLCAPPFFFATIAAFLNAQSSDRRQERTFHILTPMCVMVLGFVIAMATHNTGARYFAMFLMTCGYCSFVVFLSFISNSFPRPQYKRAAAISFINAFSQLGNVAGSYTYPSTWGPSYHNSFGIGISTAFFCAVGIAIHRWGLVRENRRIQLAEETEDAAGAGGVGETTTRGEEKVGEARVVGASGVPRGFRYIL